MSGVIKDITVNVDQYLGLNKYEVDEANPHIKLAEGALMADFLKLVRLCPAALYKIGPDGQRTFDFAGCLECGTCRVAALGTAVESWRFPSATMGVEYRYG